MALLHIRTCQLLALCFMVGFHVSEPAKILLVPAPSPYRISRFATVGAALLARKHQVTMYVNKAFTQAEQVNSTNGLYTLNYMTYDSRNKVGIDSVLAEARTGKVDTVKAMTTILKHECGSMLSNELFFEKAAEMGFSLAIVDGTYAVRCVYLVPHRLDISHVTIADAEEPWATGNPLLPSFFPVPPLPFSESMSFSQRLLNLRVFVNNALEYQNSKPLISDDIEAKFQSIAPYKSLNHLASQSLLWAITGDELIDYPKPRLPFVIEVGGFQIRTPKLLAANIKSFIDRAKSGVLVVSTGTVFRNPPIHIIEKLLAAADKLRMRVLLRLLKKPKGLYVPKNVKIMPVFPINDVLGHKNVKLLITDCNQDSQIEAIYHGVPMLGVPLEHSDMYNCAKMVRKGYGLSMPVHSYTAANITSNIVRVVASEKVFGARVQTASAIFKSRPLSPLRRLVYWVEHVLEFGNEHLVPYSVLIPWYRYMMVDILLVGLAVALIVLLVVGVLLYCMVRLACRYLKQQSARGTKRKKKREEGGSAKAKKDKAHQENKKDQ